MSETIQPERVVTNGSCWDCKWPQCWRVICVFIDIDKWILLHEPVDIMGKDPMQAHGGSIYTKQEIKEWLDKMQAVQRKITVQIRDENGNHIPFWGKAKFEE